MEKIILWIVIGSIVVFGLWAWTSGPCWMYTFAAGSDIPGRCLMAGE